MASKFSRGKTVERSPSPQSERIISQLREESAYLKKTLDELGHQKGAPSDSENNKLLERILALETLREKNSQQILSRDQEIAALRQQLRPDTAEVVAGLQAQLNQQRQESETRERLFHSLKQETEEVKNKLAAVSAKCQDLENRQEQAETTTRDAAVIQEHLKDALEKNQQWLAYDQQREAYVKAVLERTCILEQQLNQANEALQQKDKEASSEVKQAMEAQRCYEELLRSACAELEEERERVAQGRQRLSQLQQQCEERQREVVEMRQQLQAVRLGGKKQLQEERRRIERLCAELDGVSARLEDERLRSAELQQQVNLLQKSLLTQHEEQKRMSVLEEQIQLSAKDLEDEKRDNQHLQRQLHKILKELRKAKDRVARLECENAQRETPSSELRAYSKVEKACKEGQQSFTSPTRAHSLLDESFLECPNCRAQYPTSRHRELLAHIDQCLD
ncbi:centrosomal protein of 55 kDa-like [Colossoma macropomum]|uniref:centrosomal protein of 55 kDa-like n=1 Tax=Colossoma macropomum TaxID=42526 RepID=UPI0018647C92|nr:centrosomal protein of 55 kDa-like [Colossoma macropomum]